MGFYGWSCDYCHKTCWWSTLDLGTPHEAPQSISCKLCKRYFCLDHENYFADHGYVARTTRKDKVYEKCPYCALDEKKKDL